MGVADTELVDRYTRALAFFGEQVQAVTDNDWDLPTPAGEWDVRAVVAHVVVGESQIPDMLAGRPVPVSDSFDPGVLGTNPLAVWRGTALRAIDAVRGATDRLDEAVLPHPLGDMPASRVIGFRVTDNLVHGWDIAVAGARSVELPDDLAEWCLDFWLPLADGLAGSGYFGPMVEPPPGASAGIRLVSLLGRQVR